MKRIAIFASGRGTNAQNIIEHFRGNSLVKVECIICNNPKAGIIEIAQKEQVPLHLITRSDLYENDVVLKLLRENKIDLVVLAGFLWMIPEKILDTFPKRILNIHPALLPKYGGANMYGLKVHDAVIANKEKESGITIHYLNEKYDEGEIIFQKKIPVEGGDTAESLAVKIQQLEYEWYPKIIEQLLAS